MPRIPRIHAAPHPLQAWRRLFGAAIVAAGALHGLGDLARHMASP